MAGRRVQQSIPLEIAPGILMEQTPRGAVRRWQNGLNVRWRDGLPEKMGGFIEQVLTDDADVIQHYIGRARSQHEWESLDGQNWIAFGTHCKLYLVNNLRLYDITPIRRTATIIDGITTEAGSTTVTIRDPRHDAQQGDHVRFSGASAVGGITIGGEYTITQVIDLDTYTIEHPTAASATQTGGRVMTAEYDISCGLETDGTLRGYGTGDYGEEEYGTARQNSSFGGYARVWSLDNWGEDLLASPNGEALYRWQRRLGPHSRAVRVEGAPANIEHMLVGPDDRHVIVFGANTVSTGEQDKMFVRWSMGDQFVGEEAWIASATNDAGSKRLDIGSRLITAVKTRRGILIFSDKALYFLSLIGGQNVYAIEPVAREVSIVSKMAAVDVGGVVYFMAAEDFYIWDGALQLLPCEVRSWVFDQQTGIHRQAASKVHARYLEQTREVIWDFPANGSLENNRSVIFNVAERCWYVSDIARECRGPKNGALGFPVAFSNGRMWLHEHGVDADDAPLVTFLESFEGEIDPNGDASMLVNHLIPDFKVLSGSVRVSLFGRDYPGATRRQSPTATVTASTETVDLRFRGRQAGIRIESNALGDHWRMGTWRLRAGPIGLR